VGALILIAGIIVNAVRGDGETPPGSSTTAASGPVTLACVPGLEEVCAALGEALGVGAADYEPGSAVADGVVVIAPVGDLPEGTTGQVVGRSPVAIAVWRERALVLEQFCGGAITPDCLEAAYGQQWGDLGGDPAWAGFNLCLADPTRTTAALEAWRAVAADGVPEGLEASLRQRTDNETDLMSQVDQFGTARCHVVLASEVGIAAWLDAVQDVGRLQVYYPDPGPWVEYAAAAQGDGAAALVARLLTPEVQALLPAQGLRPASGEAVGLPNDLGTPGQPLGPLTAAERDALLSAWQDM